MANNSNDDSEIVINGKLQLNVDSVDKDVQKLIASFRKLEQTGSSKLAKDFQSITAVAKTLDKELATIMNRFTKNEAKAQIMKVNSSLKDQVDIIKKSTLEVERLQKALENVNPDSEKFKVMTKAMQIASQRGSAALAGVVEGQQQKNAAQSVLSARTATMLSGAGRAVELGGMGFDAGMTQWGQEAYRMQKFRSQYSAQGQNMASMMSFDPIAASLFSMQGGNRQIAAGNKAGQIEIDRKYGKVVGEGLATGLTTGGETAMMGPEVAIPAALGATAISVGKNVMNSGDLFGLSGSAQREANERAIRAQHAQEMIAGGKINTQYVEDMVKDLASKAPGRQSLSGFFGGAGGYGSAMRGIYSGHGFSPEEMMERAQALGATGISDEQRNLKNSPAARGLLSSLLNTERATGISTQEQIAGGKQFMGISAQADSTRALREFSDAVRDGVMSGFKQGQIAKDFANAALGLASSARGKINDTKFYQSQLLGALGNIDRGKTTTADLQRAASGIDQANRLIGGKTTRSMATNLLNITKQNPGLSTRSQMILSHITNPHEILDDPNNPDRITLLSDFGGDEAKMTAAVNNAYSGNLSGQFSNFGINLSGFEEFSNTKKREDFVSKIRANDAIRQKNATIQSYNKTHKKHKALLPYDTQTMIHESQMASMLGLATGEGGMAGETALRRLLGVTGDVTTGGQLTDQSAHTQERQIAGELAKRQAVNDKIRNTKGANGEVGMADVITSLFKNMDTMGKAMTDPTKGLGHDIGDMTKTTAEILAFLEVRFGKTVSGDEVKQRMLLDNTPITPPTRSSGATTADRGWTRPGRVSDK